MVRIANMIRTTIDRVLLTKPSESLGKGMTGQFRESPQGPGRAKLRLSASAVFRLNRLSFWVAVKELNSNYHNMGT